MNKISAVKTAITHLEKLSYFAITNGIFDQVSDTLFHNAHHLLELSKTSRFPFIKTSGSSPLPNDILYH